MPNGNRIIREQPSVIRGIARRGLSGQWLTVFLGVLLYFALTDFIVNFFEVFVTFGKISAAELAAQAGSSLEGELNLGSPAAQKQSISYLASFYQFFMYGALKLGLASFILEAFRHRKAEPAAIFDGFGFYSRALLMSIEYTVRVALWTMLFVFPGIIAAIRYSQCYFILADDPSKNPHQCIEESKDMMEGNKTEFLALCFSFFGWAFLAMVPQIIDQEFIKTGSKTADFLIMIVTSLPLILVFAYLMTARAVFYDMLTGRLIPKAEAEQQASPAWRAGETEPFAGPAGGQPSSAYSDWHSSRLDQPQDQPSMEEPHQEEKGQEDSPAAEQGTSPYTGRRVFPGDRDDNSDENE